MTTITAPRMTAAEIGRPKITTTATANTAAEMAARLSALRQVGGRSRRLPRRSREILRASTSVGGRRPERRRAMVMDVEGYLGPAALGQEEADRPDARQTAARLTEAGGDPAGQLEVVGREVQVEGNERRPGGDEQRAFRRVDPRRAEVRFETPRRHALGEPGAAAGAQGRALPALLARRRRAA